MGGLHVLYVDECMMDRERQSDVTIGKEWGCSRLFYYAKVSFLPPVLGVLFLEALKYGKECVKGWDTPLYPFLFNFILC